MFFWGGDSYSDDLCNDIAIVKKVTANICCLYKILIGNA